MFVLFVFSAIYGLVVFSIGWTKKPKDVSFLGCGAIGIIASSIIMAYGSPSRDYPNGNSEMVVVGCILIGISVAWLFASIKAAKAKVKREAEEKKIATLNKYKQEEKKQYDLAHTFGLEKYHKIDTDDARKYQEGIQAMRQLGMMVQQSVYQEKEHDWAIHGGIAQGIAGPAAGIAAAANVMQENARIRADNAARREWGVQQNRFYQDLASKASAKSPVPITMSELERKYVAITSWSPLTLQSFLSFETPAISIDGITGAVEVTVKWSQSDRGLCIDGALRAKLYTAEKKCAGCAYLVLPKAGTATFKGTISGVCSVPKPSTSYSIEIEPVDLWELAPKQSEKKKRAENLTDEEHTAVVNNLEKKFLQELSA